MDKLKKVIEQYGRWSALTTYTERIETYLDTDFSQALENSKAILEAIGKEICSAKGVALDCNASINAVMKKAFQALGYNTSDLVLQLSSALATIGQKMGDLRNEIGSTAHGRPLGELQGRNAGVDDLTREFLIDTTVIVSCFLIRTFENEAPRISLLSKEPVVSYEENESFNDFWDETYGDFEMGDYSYTASEILYHVDYPAYLTENKAYSESKEGDE